MSFLPPDELLAQVDDSELCKTSYWCTGKFDSSFICIPVTYTIDAFMTLVYIHVRIVLACSRPLNSHSATMRLMISAVISRPHGAWRPHFSRSTVSEHKRLTYFNTTGGLIDSRNTKTSNFGI